MSSSSRGGGGCSGCSSCQPSRQAGCAWLVLVTVQPAVPLVCWRGDWTLLLACVPQRRRVCRVLSELCKQRETLLGESTQPTSRDSQRQPVCFCTRGAFDQADLLGFLGVSSQCPLDEPVHRVVCVVLCAGE